MKILSFSNRSWITKWIKSCRRNRRPHRAVGQHRFARAGGKGEYQRQGAPGGAGVRPRAGGDGGLAAGRLLLNNLVVFAPQRAFDERSDIFYYRVIQSINNALAAHEVRLRYCALEENDSDANLFLARMNEAETQAAMLLGIDDPHIHDLAADLGNPAC
jgi:hypothetical protein